MTSITAPKSMKKSAAVEEFNFGHLNYSIKKNGRRYELWLNGCRIGRPRPDKPANEPWEYSAANIADARRELKADAKSRLDARIADLLFTAEELQRHVTAIIASESEQQ